MCQWKWREVDEDRKRKGKRERQRGMKTSEAGRDGVKDVMYKSRLQTGKPCDKVNAIPCKLRL